MAAMDGLRSLLSLLDDVRTRASSVRSEVEAATASYSQHIAAVVAAQEEVQRAASSTISTMASAAGSIHESGELMSSSAGRAVETSERAAQQVVAAARRIEEQAGAAHEVASTRLDDLAQAIANTGNAWDKALLELIDSVKLGVTDVEDLLSKYGDAMIQGERVREYLKGLDLTVYRDNVQELVRALHDGQATIGDTLKFLSQSQLGFAKQFAEVIQLFQAGKVTLQRVRDVVAQIERIFPDTDFADLAGAIEDALRKDQL